MIFLLDSGSEYPITSCVSFWCSKVFHSGLKSSKTDEKRPKAYHVSLTKKDSDQSCELSSAKTITVTYVFLSESGPAHRVLGVCIDKYAKCVCRHVCEVPLMTKLNKTGLKKVCSLTFWAECNFEKGIEPA